jgi:hypothetical protein
MLHRVVRRQPDVSEYHTFGVKNEAKGATSSCSIFVPSLAYSSTQNMEAISLRNVRLFPKLRGITTQNTTLFTLFNVYREIKKKIESGRELKNKCKDFSPSTFFMFRL